MYKVITLGIFIIFLNGCSILRHELSSEPSENHININENEKVTFSFEYISSSRNYENEYSKFMDRTKNIIPKRSELIADNQILNRSRKHIDISIKKSDPGDPGQYLAALTLFIIPSWRTFEDNYMFSFTLHSGQQITKKISTIDTTMYTQLFLFPLFIFGAYDEELYDHYEKSLKEFLYE